MTRPRCLLNDCVALGTPSLIEYCTIGDCVLLVYQSWIIEAGQEYASQYNHVMCAAFFITC